MTFQVIDTNRLIDNARINLPGALDGAIMMELFSVLNNFFQATNAWQDKITVNVTSANTVGSTKIIASGEGRINRLLVVMDANNMQRACSMPVPGCLKFLEQPSGNETWSVYCAITVKDPVPTTGPLVSVPRAPEWILQKYGEGILDGILGRMFMQKGKPYSDPNMGRMRWARFCSVKATCKTEVLHENTFGAQRWTFPQNFATGHRHNRGVVG